MESEFIALDKAGKEAEWLRQFVEDVPGWPKPMSAICIHCDCQSAIGRAQSAMYKGKSRHIRRRHNTIRQLLSMGVISIDYVRSKDNIADPFTKGLSRELVHKSSRGMGLKPFEQQQRKLTTEKACHKEFLRRIKLETEKLAVMQGVAEERWCGVEWWLG
ncbi:hypothetical protein E3N88_40489 [Mikania micrantha]|uniref:Uncharacterized protein n=1 Tax=Mikania micrantha TaxID=192012 RepID=A0A5N6LMR2_9ASTR|nr:hypothetical protein E3N88_40489 [Mikania micrantha]